MNQPLPANRITDLLWIVTWGMASSLWCLTASSQLGATFDEPFYVAEGLRFWHEGSHGALLRKGTMPLATDLQTLPLYLWERWQGVMFKPTDDLEHLLPIARAGTLVFWWVLLLYAWRAGNELAGPWAGRVAVAWIALEPNFLAHASLATTDIAVTACLLALLYHFRIGRHAGWTRRIGVPALWLTAAMLSKASALVFAPVGLLMVELDRLVRSQTAIVPPEIPTIRTFLSQLKPFRRDVIHIFLLALCLTFLYCGSDWQQNSRFVTWAHSLPDGPGGRTLIWVSEHLRIFSNAGNGLGYQITHNLKGHGAYLLGESHPRAVWYYFPVLLTIKLSLPWILMPILVAVVRPGALVNWASLSGGTLLAFSPAFRVQIGIRMILPLLALLAVGLSAAIVQAAGAAIPRWKRQVVAAGAAAGLLWTSWSSFTVLPHGLCFVNSVWTAKPSYLLESSCDWGQGLKELERWQKEQGLSEVSIWYYGTDPSLRRTGLRELPLHELSAGGHGEVAPRVEGRYLAVSTSLLYGPIMPSAHQAVVYLRSQSPVARTSTFLIFDFTGKKGGSA